jgi:glycosyltransferase involved in cell wall biosynthesis
LTTPLVSVVIPTSGRINALRRAIESLLRSNLVPSEVIVVADSSLPANWAYFEELIEEYGKRFKVFVCTHSPRASGAAATRNEGLSLASHEFVAFLDDDDEFLPEKLGSQIQAMRESGAVFSFSDYYQVSEGMSSYLTCKPKLKYKGNLAQEIAFDDCRIATPTVVVKLSFIRKLYPLFPEAMKFHEDHFAWLRISLTPGFKFVHVSEALVRVNLLAASVQRPMGKKGGVPAPLISMQEREMHILARANGVSPPFFHTARVTIKRSLVRSLSALVRSIKRSRPKRIKEFKHLT